MSTSTTQSAYQQPIESPPSQPYSTMNYNSEVRYSTGQNQNDESTNISFKKFSEDLQNHITSPNNADGLGHNMDPRQPNFFVRGSNGGSIQYEDDK